MPRIFTPELGEKILRLVGEKNWKVCYEYRNFGSPGDYQSLEDVFGQLARSLKIGPRYHVFPGPISFEYFSKGLVSETLQTPMVTIAGAQRIVFGFGLREDYCFFVTNTRKHGPSADREPKEYEYMLEALETLEAYEETEEKG